MAIARKISSIFIVLALLFSVSTTTVQAAGTAYFSKASYKCYTVKTKKAPWYSFSGQKITVNNTGNTAMTVIVYKNGNVYKQLTCLKGGKSHTFSLGANTTYTISMTPHWSTGGPISGNVSSNKYVSSVK